jgi:hypothetical protein
MTLSVGPGELLCPICGETLDSNFDCANGHTLFDIANATDEIRLQLEQGKLLTDEPIDLREKGESTVPEVYGGVAYEHANTRYETEETKTQIVVGRRQFLQSVAGGIVASSVTGPLLAYLSSHWSGDYQKQLSETISLRDLQQFCNVEHDRDQLIEWAKHLGDRDQPLKRLLLLQIGILDGSDLRGVEAAAKHLAHSQSGPARARTFVQYAKILLLTGELVRL